MKNKKVQKDIFGNTISKGNPNNLRMKFIEPPFSVLDTKSGSWMKRKNQWKSIGIKSEVGRNATTFNMKDWMDSKKGSPGNNRINDALSDTSIFDPALCEVLYNWFCPEDGSILDPFAGGSVRGIVANYLGYNYTGIDIRKEQIDSNKEQGLSILEGDNQPTWIVGDSDKKISKFKKESFDMIFTCPPYANLEVYSKLEGDISNMDYPEFMESYKSIIKKACDKLKPDGYAVFIVGEVRGKDGNYLGFVPDTVRAFTDTGMGFYNEGILLNSIGTASMRARGNMKNKKLVKVHQNILVFKKGEV